MLFFLKNQFNIYINANNLFCIKPHIGVTTVNSKKQNLKNSIKTVSVKKTSKFIPYLSEILDMNLEEKITNSHDTTYTPEIKPIIKWAGGKRLLLKEIITEFPKHYNDYYEPFTGGGAVVFGIRHNGNKITINDINPKLVNLYLEVKNNPIKLMVLLDLYTQNHSESFYYQVREKFSANQVSRTELAAMFIYLNKAGFNGLYRENSKGGFNVPFGKKEKVVLYELENLIKISEFLRNVNILNNSYEDILKSAKKGDLIYLDPPYFPINAGSFTKYSQHDFKKEDHIKLFNLVKELTEKGVYCIISNSNSDFIKELFKDFKIKKLCLSRSINSNGEGRKKEENEILISNVELIDL